MEWQFLNSFNSCVLSQAMRSPQCGCCGDPNTCETVYSTSAIRRSTNPPDLLNLKVTCVTAYPK